MKRCPECGRTFTDPSLQFCLYDGKPLAADIPPPVVPAGPSPVMPGVAPPPAAKGGGRPWGLIVAGVVVLLLVGRSFLHGGTRPSRDVGRSQPAGQTRPAGDPTTQPEPGTDPTSGPPPSDSSGLRGDLEDAIRRADLAEAEANRTLDPSPLYPCYTGTALQREVAAVEAFRQKGTRVDARLLNTQYGDFRVSQDSARAEVDVTETWSMTLRSAVTDRVVGSIPANVVPQTVTLRRGDNGWIVENIAATPSANSQF